VKYPFAGISTRSDGIGSQLLDRIFSLALAHRLGSLGGVSLLPEWPKWPMRAGNTDCFPNKEAEREQNETERGGNGIEYRRNGSDHKQDQLEPAGCASVYNDALRVLVQPQTPLRPGDGSDKYPGLPSSARRCWPPWDVKYFATYRRFTIALYTLEQDLVSYFWAHMLPVVDAELHRLWPAAANSRIADGRQVPSAQAPSMAQAQSVSNRPPHERRPLACVHQRCVALQDCLK
jgi:hypothetical protein